MTESRTRPRFSILLRLLVAALWLGAAPRVSLAQFGAGGSPYGSQVDSPDLSSTAEPASRTRKRSLFLRPAKKTPAEQWAYAKSLEESHPKKAMKQYRALVNRWPDAAEAPQAQLTYARMLQDRGKPQKAFDEYRYLLDRYAGSFPHYEEVLDQEFELAKILMRSRKGKFLLFQGFDAPERAIPLLEEVVRKGPQWEHAPEAQYLIGSIQETGQDYEEAIQSYDLGFHRYPASPFAARCAFGRARCLYALSNESPNDEMAAQEAYAAMVLFTQTFPKDEDTDLALEYTRSLRRRLARSAYDRGVFYERVARKPKAAVAAYREFIKAFPTSEWTSVAELRIDALERKVKDTDDKK